MCLYSSSRNDVSRVAQRYGTIAAHTRRRASVPVVFCLHMYSFAGLIKRTPPPTFSDTAITDRHSDTTIFQLRAHWVRISWSIGSDKLEKSFGHVPPVGVEPSTSHTCQVLGKSKSEIARAPLIFAYNLVIKSAEKAGAQVLRVRFFSLSLKRHKFLTQREISNTVLPYPYHLLSTTLNLLSL